MDEVVIQVRNFAARYGDKVVLEDVNFDIHKGEIFVILGGSGCGKSTLLKHIIGLYKPFKGDILMMGHKVDALDELQMKKLVKYFGVMYQNGALFGSMTVLENLRLPLEEYTKLPREVIDEICLSKLALVGLSDSGPLLPSELSGGMRKRVAIARAMVLDPNIIFLDEPSAGLDPITSVELDDLIIKLSRKTGMTFVVVTHELDSIFSISDRVIMLDKTTKGIIAEGNPHHLKEKTEIPAVYNFFNRIPETKI